MNPNKIKLWSIQDEQGWRELNKHGVFKADKALVDQDFLKAYDWMKVQMNQRIGPSIHENQYPVWAWYQATNEKKMRPDLREAGHLASGEVGYRIEFEKEANEVLLSDFELWHYVINQLFLADTEGQANEFEKEIIKGFGTRQFEELPRQVQENFSKSWEKIFDLDFEAKNIASPLSEKQIQATFWDLRLDEVVRIDRFIAR